MRANKEYQICKAISVYLKLQYPKIMFHWDYAGLNLTKTQAGMMKAIQGERGYPDLFIAQKGKGWSGLFLEVKDVTPYLRDNMTLKSNTHLLEQQANHLKLKAANYRAVFVTGFDEAKQELDWYLRP